MAQPKYSTHEHLMVPNVYVCTPQHKMCARNGFIWFISVNFELKPNCLNLNVVIFVGLSSLFGCYFYLWCSCFPHSFEMRRKKKDDDDEKRAILILIWKVLLIIQLCFVWWPKCWTKASLIRNKNDELDSYALM